MDRPYYQDDLTTIYHGDCREILPNLPEVDCVITDPPYGARMPSQRTGKRADIVGNDRISGDWIDSVRLSDAGSFYCFTVWDTLHAWRELIEQRGLRVRSCIVWDKMIHGLGDLTTCWAPQHELCLFASKGRHELTRRREDVIRCQRENDTSHPYEKPVALMSRLMSASNPSFVLDPFCGSGPVLVAAKLDGRRSIGIEIEEKYCELAANRLRQRVLAF